MGHRITASEAAYKLCRVKAVVTGPNGVPYLHTNDGRTIRYPDPNAKVNDSVQLDLATNKIQDCQGHLFATRLAYVFVIGKGNKPFISLPKGKGIKLSIAEERDKRARSQVDRL